ncbi:MAG: arginine--tRNA ligase [Proteobacteria bacterium]|nr:arginine--tRNA ligase [Pseudomonadota bacterium]MBU1594906.1 arginine--tRNA ligase [Pseudomonadota bacterium]
MKAKQYFEEMLRSALTERALPWPEKAVIEPPRERKFGDYSANVCMLLAGAAGMKPRELAEALAADLRTRADQLERVEVAGPGFLNVTFAPGFWHGILADVQAAGAAYGASDLGRGQRVQVEYVSANPTGPLHIGHGRGAALGDSLARLLKKTGHQVECEYYVNDAGRQMRILGDSVWLRLRQLAGRQGEDLEDFYRGEYIKDIAAEVYRQNPDIFEQPENTAIDICFSHAVADILGGIQKDLADFRVGHDRWFSEKSLVQTDGPGALSKVDETFADLLARDLAYEEDGALWFRSTNFGDDKDRVLRKSSGELTYFASDISYHHDKFQRGFDRVIDIWGADHHGYVSRMQGAVEALGRKGALQVILVQLVSLLKDGEQVAMSTRAGKFETLSDVVAYVGTDAARFLFLSRKSDSQLEFDLELVRRKSMDNPVFYVQYAHARVYSMLAKAELAGIRPASPGPAAYAGLAGVDDLEVCRLLERFPDVVAQAAEQLAPHQVSHYLSELAAALHRYYSKHHVLSAGPEVAAARLLLLSCVAATLAAGLDLLGVEAPERMDQVVEQTVEDATGEAAP